VIDWHERGVIPLGAELTRDPRTRLACADFFERAQSVEGFDPQRPGRRFHAVLLDVDHSPRNLLDPRNAKFYRPEGLRALASHLHSGGVFALWSDDPPDDEFVQALRTAFREARTHVVTFWNPVLERDSASTVYVARTA
jgi:spermidine synthase